MWRSTVVLSRRLQGSQDCRSCGFFGPAIARGHSQPHIVQLNHTTRNVVSIGAGRTAVPKRVMAKKKQVAFPTASPRISSLFFKALGEVSRERALGEVSRERDTPASPRISSQALGEVSREREPPAREVPATGRDVKLYLAGPDCFRTDASELYRSMKELALNYGFQGLSPFDSEVDVNQPDAAGRIFLANVQLIDECDVVVANINPFRGCCIDDGTSFEIGAAFAKGKRIVCYSERVGVPMKERVTKDFAKYGEFLEADRFPLLEDFAGNTNPVNLMIAEASKSAHGGIFESFEKCLEFLAHSSGHAGGRYQSEVSVPEAKVP